MIGPVKVGKKVKVEDMVYCTSDDHEGTIHDRGDTDPYDYGYKVCALSDHRILYWSARKGDYPT